MTAQLQIPFSAGKVALANELAAILRQARLRRNWTQYKAAQKMGIAQSTVSQCENAVYLSSPHRAFPSTGLIEKFCETYNLPKDVMLERFSTLRGLNGKGPTLKTGNYHVGHTKPRSNVIPFPEPNWRDVDEFELPDMIAALPKPGLGRDTLIAFAIWAAVVCVAVWQIWRAL